MVCGVVWGKARGRDEEVVKSTHDGGEVKVGVEGNF